MIVGCYSMHLYCRYSDASGGDSCVMHNSYPAYMGEYTGRTYGECKRQAQKDGWVFNRDGDVTCPYCNTVKGKS